MEDITNTSDVMLLNKLNFKLNKSATYIDERTSVTNPSESGSRFSNESGAKMIRFKISGHDWFDPETFVIKFTLVNEEAGKVLYPINPDPSNFFKRWRLSIRGQLVEDITQYARCSNLFNNVLSSQDSFENSCTYGFGTYRQSGVQGDFAAQTAYPELAKGILGGSNRQVIFKPLSGFFGHKHFHDKFQQNYLPLRYCGSIDIELELNDTTEPIAGVYAGTDTGAILTDSSQKWSITNPTCHYDVLKIDSSLNENYTKHMTEDGTLHMPYCTFISSLSTILNNDSQISISRSLSKLETIYISLYKKFTDIKRIKHGTDKLLNNFWSPNSGVGELVRDSYNIFNYDDKIQNIQLNVGSKVFPVYPIESTAACLYELRKAMKNNFTDNNSCNINSDTYRSNKFVTAFNLCKDSDSEISFAGYNTKNATMVLKLTTSGDATNRADMLHTVLVAEQILTLSNLSARVSD